MRGPSPHGTLATAFGMNLERVIFRKFWRVRRNRIIKAAAVWWLAGIVAVSVSEVAGERLASSANGHDLQSQVKATANKVIPAVVSIGSTVMVRDQAFSDDALPFGLFKEPPTRRQYGQGSGVIVSPDGYIVTNNHVIADAVDVE